MKDSLPARRGAWFLGTLIAVGLCALGASGMAAAGLDEGAARSSGGSKGGSQKVREITVLSNRADLDLRGRRACRHGSERRRRVVCEGDPERQRRHARVRGSTEWPLRRSLTGLRDGQQRPDGRLPATAQGRQITIRNHPIGGPVFAGPQVTPFLCNPNASNPPLGAAIDAQCNAPTKVDLLYRNTATPAQFVAYDPANPPAATSIAQTTTDAGKTVPFIVQRVTGTADRGIYQIAVLVDPSKPIEPWSTEQPWSHKLFYTFGGACGNRTQPDRARQRAPGDAARARLRGRDLEPEHLREQLQRPRLGRGDDDDQGDRDRALRRAPVHRGERRLRGVDAAASARRELPRPARRDDHEPGLPRPHGARCSDRSTAGCSTTTSGRRARS